MNVNLFKTFTIKEFQGVLKVGEVSVYPGDYVFGDMDGVVVVPRALAEEVMIEAEKAVRRERKMRQSSGRTPFFPRKFPPASRN